MAINLNDLQTRADVAQYLESTSRGWKHGRNNGWDAVAVLIFRNCFFSIHREVGTSSRTNVGRFG